jgi:HSP20 family protein
MVMLFSDPVDAMLQLQQALDTFHASDWLGASPSASGAYPPFNLFHKGDEIVLIAEVPGVRKEDLQIQVKDRTIRVAGRKAVGYGQGTSLHRRERLAGAFDRAISLPIEIDAERVKAECRDGILAISLTRAERDKPRTIAVG